MGTLTLLTVTLYLMQRGRNYWFTAIPMLFMIGTTVVAMLIKIKDFWEVESYLLLAIGLGVFGLSIWLVVEAILRVRKGRGVTRGQHF